MTLNNNINLIINNNDVHLVRFLAIVSSIPSSLEAGVTDIFGFIGKTIISVIGFILAILLSPFLILLLKISHNRLRNLVEKYKYAEQQLTKENLVLLDFKDVKELEFVLEFIFKLFNKIISDESAKNNIVTRNIYQDIVAINCSTEVILNNIRESYKISAFNLFESEEDYKEYVNELKSLQDIWNYPSAQNEQETAFIQNKKIIGNKMSW